MRERKMSTKLDEDFRPRARSSRDAGRRGASEREMRER
jgi:hypothetical protein